ncbi:NAD(P)H-quinone oxidoreductase [Paenibacillus sp. 1P07SE]|uniref:NAD(P)H-quinone oxidoreductase n=1 Tax=Paenibacillus sp. 1P07SE TaxID=3132209 RepID=UPI0039A6AA8C
MKAICVDEKTKQLYVGEAAEPQLQENDLLVEVRATALNRADLLQRRGLYPPPPGASDILGLEMSGVVLKAGVGASGWQPGDRVCGLLPGGGYASRVSLPAGMAMRIPDELSFEEAAAIPEAFLTAYLNLMELGGLRAGQTALIHAGASGVGTAAIQLVREAGAHAIITAGTAAKREAALSLGAQLAIDYKAGPFAPMVMEATGDRGVEVVLDPVGASYWDQHLEVLAVDGRLVLIGLMGGSKLREVDLGRLLSRRIQVIGSTLRSRSREDKIRLTRDFAAFALPRFADGRLRPVIDTVMDWSQAGEAHDRMQADANIGKIVLQVQT